MKTISQSEIDDYKAVLKKNGYSENDFEYEEKDTTGRIPPSTLYSINIVPLTGTITIKRISTKRYRAYNTGQASRWVAEFSDDLENGHFD